jgi:hypothetical protein
MCVRGRPRFEQNTKRQDARLSTIAHLKTKKYTKVLLNSGIGRLSVRRE